MVGGALSTRAQKEKGEVKKRAFQANGRKEASSLVCVQDAEKGQDLLARVRIRTK